MPIIVISLALLAAPLARAQNSAFDAAHWKSLPPQDKAMYIRGFTDGSDSAERLWSGVQSTAPVKMTQDAVANAQRLTSYRDLTTELLVQGVDTFYNDPQNGKIPVANVLLVVRYRLGGSVPPGLELLIATLRKRFPSNPQ